MIYFTAKISESSKFAYNGSFRGLNVQNFMLLYENSGGVKTILWKRNLAQILLHSYTLNSCNKFLEVLFVAS